MPDGKAKNQDDVASLSFEEALDERVGIVERLEQGEGRLDEAIGAYDRGARLKRHCEQKLREAQERIERIAAGPGGEPKAEPFDES